MPITIAEKKQKTKEKRSRAISNKINLLRSRDGSVAPPIEAQNDIDEFNLSMIFGSSMSESIDWNHLGVDGLIRAYYTLLEKLNGTTRTNIVTDNDGPLTEDSSIQSASDLLLEGEGHLSGFYSDNKNDGRRGIFDVNSDSFKENGKTVANTNTDNIVQIINELSNFIGEPSPLNPGGYSAPSVPGTGDPPSGGLPAGRRLSYSDLVALGRVSDSILGRRYSDVNEIQHTQDDGDGGTNTTWEYGNGAWDTSSNPLPGGYTPLPDLDYYDPELHTKLTELSSRLDEAIQFIEYAKVSDTTYFANTDIIPGFDDYIDQDAWIALLNNIKQIISQYLSDISLYYTSGDRTSGDRTTVRNLLQNLKSDLDNGISDINTIIAVIDSQNFYGDPNNASTLWGARVLWIKTLLDPTDGSRITIGGIETALTPINQSIAQAEEEFGIFGISKEDYPWSNQAWESGLPTPNIAGIETYATIDSDLESDSFGEMIITGYIIAWEETSHATGYNVWKSTDWDGSAGTWELILPAGNSFTVEDIDLNKGTVLSYYIDQEVDPENGEKPYYKVQSYDSGGQGDYSRIPAQSEVSLAKNYDDFLGADSTTPFVGPSGPAPSQPGDVPPYLFKWTTVKSGSESANNPINTQFESEAAFDSVGSNLEVFVNGELVHRDVDYIIESQQRIKFNSTIDDTSKVSMIVYFGGSSSGANSWKDPVNVRSMLPTVGNSAGDIRLVVDENILYVWNIDFNNWDPVQSATSIGIDHGDLADMPDNDGINPDHDGRYYTEIEIDDKLSLFESRLNQLKHLLPDEPNPLSGSLRVMNTTMKTGYLSEGSHNFNTLNAHQVFSRITKDDSFYFSQPADDQIADGDKGTLTYYLNGVEKDSFNLGDAFIFAERSGQQSWTPTYGTGSRLQIVSVEPHESVEDYQKCIFKIHIVSGDLLDGENEIKIIHTVGEEDRESDSYILFYDSSSSTMYFDSVYLDEQIITSSKYLSGVRFYSMGDVFRVRFYAHNMFNNTYTLPNQFDVNLSEIGASSYSDNYTSQYITNIVTGAIDEIITYDRNSTINQANIISSNANISIKGRNPFAETPEYTPNLSQNVLINTYSQMSNEKEEFFVDEYYRLNNSNHDTVSSNITQQWNSISTLKSSDLQVFNGNLLYPQADYSDGYLPAQATNYLNFLGIRYYLRAFRDVGYPHNNGSFLIEGYNISDADTKIYMKLPSETGWLDMTKPYNEADFTGQDGDGCLLSNSNYNYNWTSGRFSTANSGYMVILRVEMKSMFASPISRIKIDW